MSVVKAGAFCNSASSDAVVQVYDAVPIGGDLRGAGRHPEPRDPKAYR